jgi:hypothetical protein
MAAQFISHVTQAGERWDLLAWRYYGDSDRAGVRGRVDDWGADAGGEPAEQSE